MRDVYLILKDLDGFKESVDEIIWDGEEKNSSLHSDMDWRAGHLGVEANYWNLAASDMPWQLTEGIAMGSQVPVEGLQPIGRHVEKQSLSAHPFFKDSQIVRNPFRCFHRSDGRCMIPLSGIVLIYRVPLNLIANGWRKLLG